MGGKININAEQILTFCVLWLITTVIMELCKNAVKEDKYEKRNNNNYYKR